MQKHHSEYLLLDSQNSFALVSWLQVILQIKSSLLFAKYIEKKRKRKHNHQLKKLILMTLLYQ